VENPEYEKTEPQKDSNFQQSSQPRDDKRPQSKIFKQFFMSSGAYKGGDQGKESFTFKENSNRRMFNSNNNNNNNRSNTPKNH
jgi:hypothetical protein